MENQHLYLTSTQMQPVEFALKKSIAQKMKFDLNISSVNGTKSIVPADLATFTEEGLTGKLHFLQRLPPSKKFKSLALVRKNTFNH